MAFFRSSIQPISLVDAYRTAQLLFGADLNDRIELMSKEGEGNGMQALLVLGMDVFRTNIAATRSDLPRAADSFLYSQTLSFSRFEPFHHDQQHHERSLRRNGVVEVGFTFEEISRTGTGAACAESSCPGKTPVPRSGMSMSLINSGVTQQVGYTVMISFPAPTRLSLRILSTPRFEVS